MIDDILNMCYTPSTMKEPVQESAKITRKIRVLIADDHPLIFLALKKVFETQADIEIVAEASDGEEAVRLTQNLLPDVVIIDISMPKLNGIEATRQIKAKFPNVIVLVLTVHNDVQHVFGVFEAGADGYLIKTVLGEEIACSIRRLIAGETVLSPSLFKEILQHGLRYPSKSILNIPKAVLTNREQEIALLLVKGMSNKKIAQELNISPATVRSHLVDIFTKLNVNSRTEAAIIALRTGIVTLDGL